MSYTLRGRNVSPWRGPSLASLACWLGLSLWSEAGAAPGQRLRGEHVPPAVAHLTPAGNLPGSQRLNLAIGLPLRNPEELDRFQHPRMPLLEVPRFAPLPQGMEENEPDLFG